MFVYLQYTKQGYEIAVVGESENTARYAGIKRQPGHHPHHGHLRRHLRPGRLHLAVAGADHTISTNTAGGRGFTAIIVAWLAKFNTFVMVLIVLPAGLPAEGRHARSPPSSISTTTPPTSSPASSSSASSAASSSSTTSSIFREQEKEAGKHEHDSGHFCPGGHRLRHRAFSTAPWARSSPRSRGNLNLGVPGIMYLGGIAGLAGAFFYETVHAEPQPGWCVC